METVLRWPELVKDMPCTSFHRLLRVCVFVLSGILCLCIQRYVQTDVPETEGKDFPERTLGMTADADLSGICCGIGNVAENLMREKMEYKENFGIYVTPSPVDFEEPKAAVAVKTADISETTGRTRMTAEEWMNITEISRPVSVPGTDVPRNAPSVIEIPGTFDDRLAGKPSERPGTDSPAVSAPSVSNPAIEEEEPGINNPAIEEDGPGINNPAIEEEGPGIDNPSWTREIAGFLIDEEGYITGYTPSLAVVDGILVPAADKECIGIRKDAFSGLGSDVMEIFIPANITDIEPGALDVFSSLVYIEAAADNPVYYSEDGILYTYSGDTVVCPAER